MSVDATSYSPDLSGASSRLVRAWLLTALSDGLFSSVLAAVFYGSTVMRLWRSRGERTQR